jgi:alpha-D-xyloside xylohydrolase
MHEPADFSRITKSFDFTHALQPAHILTDASLNETTPNGVRMTCRTSGGLDTAIAIDLLDHDIVRVRIHPHQIPASPPEMLSGDLERPGAGCSIHSSADHVHLSSGDLEVHCDLHPWNLQVTRNDQPFFTQQIDDRCFGPHYESAPCGFDIDADGNLHARLSVCSSVHEKWYGFGEHFTPLVRNQQTIDLFCEDSGSVNSSRSYKAMPFLLSTQGYGLLVHTSYPSRFEMGTCSGASYSVQVADDLLDYFIIAGPTFKEILHSLSILTGTSPVLPKWSFGLWVSRCGYRSWEEVDQAVTGMRAHEIPFDVISLDPWWQGPAPWSTLSWDPAHFKDHTNRLRALAEQHIRVCLWINPYVPKGTRLYEEGVERGFFLRDRDQEIVNVTEAFAGKELAAYDFTDPHQVDWFISLLKELLHQGVAVFKTDFGEQIPLEAISSDGRSGLELHNLYPLLYNACAFEAVRQVYGTGLTWGRSGYIGSVRYPLQWGGDSYASFSQMAGQLRGMLGYGLTGIPYYSHDIGGFDYEPEVFRDLERIPLPGTDEHEQAITILRAPDAELYIRWMQFGTFSSHARIHGKRPHEPWNYGEQALRISRAFIRLRNRLLPYIFTQSVAGANRGLPLTRAMVLEFQEDRATWDIETQYMFGEDLLVVPVLQRARSALVYFPEGTWYDLFSGTRYDGTGWQNVPAPLDRLPLFLKGGSCIPLRAEVTATDQPFDDLVLICTPEITKGTLTLYDTAISPDAAVESFTITIDPAHSSATCAEKSATYPLTVVGTVDLMNS